MVKKLLLKKSSKALATAATGKPNLVGKKAQIVTDHSTLKASKSVKVFDIPVDLLVDHSENVNIQDEKTFDEVVERIRVDGFDEPIIVVPYVERGRQTNKFLIVSGHHRTKAARILNMTTVPAIIREGWNQDRIKIELLSRNMLRGNPDPHKFTELYDSLAKRYDPAQIKKMVGLTTKKQFDALYKKVADKLPPKARKKLEEAKEDIKSIDDLTGILNQIFKEHGSELDYGFMVFSHGGKKHVYVKVNDATMKKVDALVKKVEDKDLHASDVFAAMLSDEKHVDNVIRQVKADGSKAKTS